MGHGRVVTERSANALLAACSLSAQRADADPLMTSLKKKKKKKRFDYVVFLLTCMRRRCRDSVFVSAGVRASKLKA